jgi:hypothetical protein
MTTPSPNISIAGILRSTKSKGFTTQSSINEQVDNGIDASATKIAVRLNTTTSELIVADNGIGMNKAVANKAYCLHNDKPASGKNGLYGIGKSASEAVLSNTEGNTLTVTKSENDSLWEIEATWADSIAENEWNPRACRASAEQGVPLWNDEAIDPSHGTVVSIPLPLATKNSILADINKIAGELAYAYQDIPNADIQLSVDGVLQEVNQEHVLGFNDVPDEQRTMVQLEILCKNGAENKYFHSEDGEMVRFNREALTTTGKSKDPMQAPRIHDYNSSLEDGYVVSGKFVVRIVYNHLKNPPKDDLDEDAVRPEFKRGTISISRNKRHLKRFDVDVPNSGDFERQRLLGSVCCSIDFTHESDRFIKIEGNKSNVTLENVDKMLMWTVKSLVRRWGDAYYKRHVAPRHLQNVVGNANVVPRDIVSQFKLNYANPAWRAAYIEFIAANPIV